MKEQKHYTLEEFKEIYGPSLNQHVTSFGYLQVLKSKGSPNSMYDYYVRLRILDMLVYDESERIISFCYLGDQMFARIEPYERLLLLNAYTTLNHNTNQVPNIDLYYAESINGDLELLNEEAFRETEYPKADMLYQELSGRSLESDDGKWLEFPVDDQSLGFPIGFPSYYYSN